MIWIPLGIAIWLVISVITAALISLLIRWGRKPRPTNLEALHVREDQEADPTADRGPA